MIDLEDSSKPLLRSRGERSHPYQCALRVLAAGALDLAFIPIDFVTDRASHHEIRRLHGLVFVGATGVFVLRRRKR